MHISITEYHIHESHSATWAEVCDELAPAFAAVPGLMAKYWLHGDAGIRGGVYLWCDREAYLAFRDGDLGRGLGDHQHVSNLSMRDYAVDEQLTQVTRGLVASGR